MFGAWTQLLSLAEWVTYCRWLILDRTLYYLETLLLHRFFCNSIPLWGKQSLQQLLQLVWKNLHWSGWFSMRARRDIVRRMRRRYAFASAHYEKRNCQIRPLSLGCVCDDGFIRSGTKCVAESECGCVAPDGTYMQQGTVENLFSGFVRSEFIENI